VTRTVISPLPGLGEPEEAQAGTASVTVLAANPAVDTLKKSRLVLPMDILPLNPIRYLRTRISCLSNHTVISVIEIAEGLYISSLKEMGNNEVLFPAEAASATLGRPAIARIFK
jgi:hypothetical protein